MASIHRAPYAAGVTHDSHALPSKTEIQLLTVHVHVESDLAYPVLFYPDPSPSGRKLLVTDFQHMPCIHTVWVFDYPDPSPIRIFLWKTDVCGYARSDYM